MPTTPRGIWSPSDSDDWDLTVDWAAQSVSIDDAIDDSVAEAVATMPPKDYRIGTDAQRLAVSGGLLYEGLKFYTTDGNLEWRYDGAKWLITPGQTLASAETTASPTVSGSIIGGVISTIPLPIGQKVRVSCRPVGLSNISAGGVVYSMNARNNASDVTNAAYDKKLESRAYQAGGGAVVSVAGLTFDMTTTVAAKVSAALYLTAGLVYGADGQQIWIVSA